MFTKEFIFGTATSSYQIEGGFDKDGRTDSIWDEFCRIEGNVVNNENGDIACDHYHRYKEDIALLKALGVESYRFSIAWPRIFPQKDCYNKAGMDFYKAIIKELKDNNIRPAITLYHWDLPLWAHNEGGWTNRECVDWFMTYAIKCFEELGEEVELWITHNEPFCSGFMGYLIGEHAPGIRDLSMSLKAIHHILLSHGMAVKAYREMNLKGEIGITLNLYQVYKQTDRFLDDIAVNNLDGFSNRWFLDPVFKGSYPIDMINLFSEKTKDFGFIHNGDLEIISVENDFLGINYYSGNLVEYDENSEFLGKVIDDDAEKTAMGWPVRPEKLKDLIYRIRREYTKIPIHITENGAAYNDEVTKDDKIHDDNRVKYIEDHLKVVQELNSHDMNIAGYYLWSFMDNFEWAHGYAKRFGIVYVDFESLERKKKDSFYRYQEIIRNRSLD